MPIHVKRLVGTVALGLAFFLGAFGSAGAAGPIAGGAKPLAKDHYDDPLPAGVIARLGSVRFHHPGGMIAGAFAPDGQTLLALGSGAKGYSLRFWDTASGKETAAFDLAMPSSVRSVAFTPDGKMLGLCCENSIELLDRKTGKLVRRFTSKNEKPFGGILSFAFSPDGKMLAAGCMEWKDDNPIRVWEVATGRELAPFEGRGASLNAVAFSADGKRLFCGPTGGTYGPGVKNSSTAICVWDVATRKIIREIARSKWNLAFAPSGEVIAYGSDEEIHLVRVAQGTTICKIPGQHGSFGFAPDSKTLIALDADRTLTEWDAATGKAMRRFEGHLGNIGRLIGYSPDGKKLAFMDGGWNQDGSIRVWDVATGQEFRPFDGHHDEITHLAYAPNGKLLASASKDRTVRLWDPATGKPLRLLAGHDGDVFAVAFAPDGRTLASASADGTTRLWDVDTGRQLACFENPLGRLAGRFGERQISIALSFAADGKTLFAAGTNGMLVAWNWRTRKETQRKVLDRDGAARPAFLPNLGAVLTASGGEWDFAERATESLYLWKLGAGKIIQEMPLRTQRDNGSPISCSGIAASADERLLAHSQVMVGNSLRGPVYHDPILCLWERVTGKEILRIKDAVATALAFSPDSRLLAVDDGGLQFFHGSVGSKSLGRTISFWDTLTGDHQARLSGHTAQVNCIAFAPDGKTLATGSADHTILVWRTPPRKPIKADPAQPTPAELQRWWDDLAGADPAGAHKAGANLVRSPALAVALIRDQFGPARAVDPKIIPPLIKDLDSAQFQVRDKAMRELEALADRAEPALHAALATSPSLEKRRRLESLLEKAAGHSPVQVQRLRALTVLERIADAEARQVVESISKGTAAARITHEAQASLRRMSAPNTLEKK